MDAKSPVAGHLAYLTSLLQLPHICIVAVLLEQPQLHDGSVNDEHKATRTILEVLIIRDCSELIELPFSHPASCEAQWEEKMAWFPRLRELVIVDCPKLASLPPIPWCSSAPFSAEIERVGSDFETLVYNKEDKSTLRIKGKDGRGDVLWNAVSFSNLTNLKELNMNNIPSLPLDELRALTSLKIMGISGLSSILLPIEGEGHGIYGLPVEELGVRYCDVSGKDLTLLLSFFPNLSKLLITECRNIIGLSVAGHAETVSGEQQQKTRVEEEEIITAAAAEGLLLLPTHLQELSIEKCKKVILLPSPLHDHHAAAVEARAGGLQRLHSLRILNVWDCPEFLSFYSSSSSFPFPACLENLALQEMHMETLQALSNLTSLTRLTLCDLGGSSGEGLWPLLAHGCLTRLYLDVDSDIFAGSDSSRPHGKEGFPCSFKIFDLTTNNKSGVLVAPTCSLLSSTLTEFILRFDTVLEHLTEELEEALQLLTSLHTLSFREGHKLQRLPAGLHNLINLKRLAIHQFMAIQSLPSLPSSLQELQMSACDAVKSLPNSLPSSLERLGISCCKAIKSLPKDGLPSSMLELDVQHYNSEELKRACRKLIGTFPIVRT